MSIGVLRGRIIDKIDRDGDESLTFYMRDGAIYKMYHMQDCCESVTIEEIWGDLDDLTGTEVLRAEERSNDGNDDYGVSTWTFYELATIKGSVTIRWYGTSNGYYGTGVDFETVKETPEDVLAQAAMKVTEFQTRLKQNKPITLERWDLRELDEALSVVLGKVEL